MNKIYINGRFLTQSVTGVQRYAIELINALDLLIEDQVIECKKYSFCLLAPSNIKNNNFNIKNIPVKQVGYLKGHLWEQIELPYYSQDGLLINLCNAAPLVKNNQLVTIHDAAVFSFPQAYSFAFRTWYIILLTGLGKRARTVITDSLFSKKELVHYSGVAQEKVQVIYLGKEHVFSCKTDEILLKKHNLINKQFILAVSSMNPNKNFESIIKAIQLLDNENIDIVIAGGTNPTVFSKKDENLPECVKHVGYVSDEELRALYEHATCFIYPSFYEGFGLPPLEAMACGCPVIVSDAASLPEVCGDAALYCDPYSPKDIADKISLMLNDRSLREQLMQKGLERSKLFTWKKCAKEVLKIIEEVLAK
jgi:glycosyltransferase involved in cell wall biosynthesis